MKLSVIKGHLFNPDSKEITVAFELAKLPESLGGPWKSLPAKDRHLYMTKDQEL